MAISYQKPFVISVSAFLFSNIYPHFKFTAKNWPDLCKFYSNFCLRKYFYFSLLNLNYWCFTTILWKFQKKLNKLNLLKICVEVTYPIDFCIICVHFYYGKKWKVPFIWSLRNRSLNTCTPGDCLIQDAFKTGTDTRSFLCHFSLVRMISLAENQRKEMIALWVIPETMSSEVEIWCVVYM